jgi:nucleotidyltransferase substrate binding protein (TIGR01987 family)
VIDKETLLNKLSDFEKAVQTFDIVLAINHPNDIEKDAAIQRFGYTYEAAWKCIKMFVEYQGGKDIKGSRDAFKEAFRFELINEESLWENMLIDRNTTVHTYDVDAAREIFVRLPVYHQALTQLLSKLRNNL